jgi:ATPase subunit of ABC transporter with duplicated ATPase domains
MHTDPTLSFLDSVTTILGQELRRFRRTVCSAYATKDLPKETAARAQKKQRDRAKTAKNITSDTHGGSSEATESSSAQKQKSKSTECKLSTTEKNTYLQIIQS